MINITSKQNGVISDGQVKDHAVINNQQITSNTYSMNQKRFYASEQCSNARLALQQLVDNPQYNTENISYSGATLTFTDRHLQYLSTHPLVKIDGYISNLKLMTHHKRRKIV